MEEALQKETSRLNTVTKLNLSGQKFSTFEAKLLNKCRNLVELDISKNRFKCLAGISLANLKVFNFEDNCISDVTFLSDLPSLENLYLDGNPLSFADRYIAVDQLPNLKSLDGKICSDIQKAVHNFANQLDTEVKRIYSSKYQSAVINSTNPEEIIQQRRLLAREVTNRMSACSNLPPKFQKYKIQDHIELLFRRETMPKKSTTKKAACSPSVVRDKFNDLKLSSPSTRSKHHSSPSQSSSEHCKIMRDACASLNYLEKSLSATTSQTQPHSLRSHDSLNKTAEKTPKFNKVEKLKEEGKIESRKKRKLRFDEPVEQEKKINYDPEMFLRCHVPTNSLLDCNTQVWAASFEIDIENENQTTDVVATCGGNIICFINCRTGHIVKRYKSRSATEDFYCLDWTTSVCSTLKKKKTTVLAAAGVEGKIYLIHPSQLSCYHIFKAHKKAAVNCIKFHRTNNSWLFSGGTDCLIHLWDIGEVYMTKGKSHKKLMTFEADDEVIQIAIATTYNCFFASTDLNLLAWNLKEETSWTKKPSTTLIIPKNLKAKDHGVVDGLTIVSEKYIAFKVSNSGKLALWDIRNICPNGLFTKKKKLEVNPETIYLWSDTDGDYNYISACTSKNLMACGDNAGCLWIYNASRPNSENKKGSTSDLTLPAVVLPWPNLVFGSKVVPVKEKIIINSVQFNWNGEYLVACSDTNLVCIWKK